MIVCILKIKLLYPTNKNGKKVIGKKNEIMKERCCSAQLRLIFFKKQYKYGSSICKVFFAELGWLGFIDFLIFRELNFKENSGYEPVDFKRDKSRIAAHQNPTKLAINSPITPTTLLKNLCLFNDSRSCWFFALAFLNDDDYTNSAYGILTGRRRIVVSSLLEIKKCAENFSCFVTWILFYWEHKRAEKL